MCFYEPLHHGLARLTHDRIHRSDPEVVRANRHPALSAPYLLEFAPLVQGRGVKGFSADFASARYCLAKGEAHPGLKRYVKGLLDCADARGRTAVLGFNRSGGRTGWLKDAFGAYDIYMSRDPEAVWGSYTAEAQGGNRTYFSMWLRVVEANRADPIWTPLAERLGVAGPIARRITATKRRHSRMIDGWTSEDSYFLTFYAWLVCATHGGQCADLLIDEALATDPTLRRSAERQITDRTGVQIDLEDFAPAPARLGLDPATRRRVERQVIDCFPRHAIQRLRLERARPRPAFGRLGELIVDVLAP